MQRAPREAAAPEGRPVSGLGTGPPPALAGVAEQGEQPRKDGVREKVAGPDDDVGPDIEEGPG